MPGQYAAEELKTYTETENFYEMKEFGNLSALLKLSYTRLSYTRKTLASATKSL